MLKQLHGDVRSDPESPIALVDPRQVRGPPGDSRRASPGRMLDRAPAGQPRQQSEAVPSHRRLGRRGLWDSPARGIPVRGYRELGRQQPRRIPENSASNRAPRFIRPLSVPGRSSSEWPCASDATGRPIWDEGLVLEAPFVISPINQSGVSWTIGHRWKSTGSPEETTLGAGFGSKYRGVRTLLCGPGSAAAEIFNQAGLYFFYLLESSQGEKPRRRSLARDIRAVETPGGTICGRGAATASTGWPCCARSLRPMAADRWRQFEVLAESDFWRGGTGRPGRAEPPTEGRTQDGSDGPGMVGDNGGGEARTPCGILVPAQNKSFEARPGQLNEWTIPLPDKLTQVVREKLKVK